MTAMAAQQSSPFEAVLYPNPPLGAVGFLLFMAVLGTVSFCIAAMFVAMGAWPVSGFFGLDFVLVGLAFHSVRRTARRREFVRLGERKLEVERVEPNGRRQSWSFEPYWVQVEIDDPPRTDSPLILRSHGRGISIGSFLTPQERLEFAQALRSALRRHRTAMLGDHRS